MESFLSLFKKQLLWSFCSLVFCSSCAVFFLYKNKWSFINFFLVFLTNVMKTPQTNFSLIVEPWVRLTPPTMCHVTLMHPSTSCHVWCRLLTVMGMPLVNSQFCLLIFLLSIWFTLLFCSTTSMTKLDCYISQIWVYSSLAIYWDTEAWFWS